MELRGFEPLTFSLRTRRATNCAKAPPSALTDAAHDNTSDARPASSTQALAARGVSSKVATELVEAHPADRIQTKLEVFDWLLKNGDKRIGKNPAGYLVASIRDDYQAPVNFKKANATAEAAKVEQAAEVAKRQDQKRTRDEAASAQDREATQRSMRYADESNA